MNEKRSVVAVVVLAFLTAFALAAPPPPPNDVQEQAESVCPRIVSRAEWKGRKARSTQKLPYSPTPYMVVHHGGLKRYCYDEAACSAIVRSYQDLHMDTNGWEDIGYNFLVGEDGNVYEGRGWDLVGAHAPGYNFDSIGVCFMGDFNDAVPNDAALRALNALMRCGLALGKLRKDYSVIGHRQARVTECPGDALFKYVQSFPNWNDQPVPIYGNQTFPV